MLTDADHRYMRIALTLAARGLGRVAPNPAVGCVLAKDGRIVGCLEEIAAQVAERFPRRFRRGQDALAYVADLLENYQNQTG